MSPADEFATDDSATSDDAIADDAIADDPCDAIDASLSRGKIINDIG
ncbi:MAG: hypothetical protein FJW13_04535 [Actinobacteria bacterium]|nr:hypothetical protein [Actinomycetota bacterium]